MVGPPRVPQQRIQVEVIVRPASAIARPASAIVRPAWGLARPATADGQKTSVHCAVCMLQKSGRQITQ